MASKQISFALIATFFVGLFLSVGPLSVQPAHAQSATIATLQWDHLKPEIQYELSRLLENADDNPWILDKFRSWLREGQEAWKAQVRYPRFYFENMMRNEDRIQLLATLLKLRSEHLLEWVKTITWAGGKGGVVVFHPAVSQDEFRKILREKGYVNLFSRGDQEWGLRSSRKGAQLHFRGSLDKMSVHIDLHNPAFESVGDYLPQNLMRQFYEHVIQDLALRDQTHTPDQVTQALSDQGLSLSEETR